MSPGSGDADFELLAEHAGSITCAGTRAPELALRLKYAGWPTDRIEVVPEIGPSLDRALARAPEGGRVFAPTHLHGADRASHPARPAWPGAGVLAVTDGATARPAIVPSPVSATAATTIGDPVLWHEAECGGYAADLPIWERFAVAGGGAVLDLGAGAGRVSLHLRRRGFEVIAIESDGVLAEALQTRAQAEGLSVGVLAADARDLEGLPIGASTVIAPMQFVHLMGGLDGRRRLLAGALSLTEARWPYALGCAG